MFYTYSLLTSDIKTLCPSTSTTCTVISYTFPVTKVQLFPGWTSNSTLHNRTLLVTTNAWEKANQVKVYVQDHPTKITGHHNKDGASRSSGRLIHTATYIYRIPISQQNSKLRLKSLFWLKPLSSRTRDDTSRLINKIVANNLRSRDCGQLSEKYCYTLLRKMNSTLWFILFS